ncbi:MAG: GMC family oxidoreductase [Planctomycetes bacterium]|nr:GMC family oxidoreductase [Planctomycetota bacterium]
MIRDLGDDAPATLPEYDVCIVGSGPAGMTVARELSSGGLRIAVLESGKLKPTPFGDRLRFVESDGIRIKEYSRERVLGGASSTWAGLSAPLDPCDFVERPWMRHSGWPIARAELLAHYEEACGRYRFAALERFGPSGFGALRSKGSHQPAWKSLEEKIFLACAEPQHFGREHRSIFDAQGVDLYLDATVLALEADAMRSRVDRARLRTSQDKELRLTAGVFVIATGGIENARLLLASRDYCERGLGNENDAVGRYLMNHPKHYHGVLRLDRPVDDLPYYFGCIVDDYAGYAGLRLREEVQRERRLLNSYARFEPVFPWTGSTGVESLVTIVKRTKFALKSFRARRKGKVVTLRDYSETGDDSDLQNERKSATGWLSLGWNVLADSPRVASYAYYRFAERAKPPIGAVRLRNFMEMEPDPENRVTLGSSRDAFGQQVPFVRHRCTELDRRSLVELHKTLRDEFPSAGLGRLETTLESADPWPIDQDASHHMGTTRMGNDPRVSVVDRTCKIHSVPNVYLAGASVFPTSGCANPTFTIVALAIRLARHLRQGARS